MKNQKITHPQTRINANSLRKIIACTIGIVAIIITTNSSLAGTTEDNLLMHHAAKLSKAGKNEEALKIFLEITRRDPKNFYAHNNLAMVYSQTKKYNKALKSYEKSLSLNPTFSMSLNNIVRGSMLMLLKKLKNT